MFTNITSLYKGLFFKCPALCTNRNVQDELIFVVSLNNNPFLSFSNYLLGFSIKKRLYTILYKAFYILWSDPVLSVPVDLPISWASGRIARWSEACIQFCFLRGQSPPMPSRGEIAPADSFSSVGSVSPVHFAPLVLISGDLLLLLLFR